MTLQPPLSSASSIIADVVLPDDNGKLQHKLDSRSSSSSTLELLCGLQGTRRRYVTTFVICFIVGTATRMALFDHRLAGTFLAANLGPVERPSVSWWPILVTRAIDIVVGLTVWQEASGIVARDGALFGALYAAASRSSLYTMEHSYFLLDKRTSFAIFAIDIVTYVVAFSLLPRLLPHAISSRPTLSTFDRIRQQPELVMNAVIAFGLGTCLSALMGFVVERIGGQALVKHEAFDLTVPAVYAADTMTTSQMMAHPTIRVPALRSDLTPVSMVHHLVHSAGITTTLTCFCVMLSKLTPLGAGLATLVAVGPCSALLFYDVLPISVLGAVAVAAFLAVRAGLVTFIISWVLEELRAPTKVQEVDIVVVDEATGEIVAAAEVDIVETRRHKHDKGQLVERRAFSDEEL
ncbi:hypothetical protein OIO90_003894 [Microbotryomycetes sp. JL221]|nr:hypothetical protein OIO90_003894 [Microbotryomycetes sp. JL221]